MSRPPLPRSDEGPATDRARADPRETTILTAVAGGLTTKAISKDLWLSEHTVKFHLTNIYRKLGVSNRSGAVRYAFENDLAPSAARAVPRRRLSAPFAEIAAGRSAARETPLQLAESAVGFVGWSGSQRSSATETTVGPPGRLSIRHCPPNRRTRSWIATSPKRPLRAARIRVGSRSKPRPLSVTCASTPSSFTDTTISTSDASLCSRTLVSAS